MSELNLSPEKIYINKRIGGYIDLDFLSRKTAKEIIESIKAKHNVIMSFPGVKEETEPVFYFEREYSNIDCYIIAEVLETDEEFQKRQNDITKKDKVKQITRKNQIEKLKKEAKALGLLVTEPGN